MRIPRKTTSLAVAAVAAVAMAAPAFAANDGVNKSNIHGVVSSTGDPAPSSFAVRSPLGIDYTLFITQNTVFVGQNIEGAAPGSYNLQGRSVVVSVDNSNEALRVVVKGQ